MTRKTQSGVAIVEFALILPFLLMLAMLATEFGRAVYRYNGMVKAVRDGVRYLSIQEPNNAAALATTRNLVVYGNPDGTGAPLDPGVDPAMVSAQWTTTGSAPSVNVVTVRVSGYTFTPMVSAFFGASIGTIAFSDISATMRSPL
ncbi:MAG TPA: TadE/TadG family type IV pilus assembly protein [Telluria sp.]|nr:TadE/TadG family type IV pilus assembly protein [Telluria sp.]